MANDIYVSFGADTGPLEAASAVAKAEVRSLTSEINRLGAEMQKTGADMDSSLGQRLNALGSNLERWTVRLNRGDSGGAENVIHFRIGGDLRCRSRIPLIFASVW